MEYIYFGLFIFAIVIGIYLFFDESQKIHSRIGKLDISVADLYVAVNDYKKKSKTEISIVEEKLELLAESMNKEFITKKATEEEIILVDREVNK